VAKRGPYKGAQARRDAIVAAAFDAFSLGGFRGTSIQDIASAVGLSKAGLLHYFQSKEELLLEVLALREHVNAWPEEVQGLDVLEHLRSVVAVDSATVGIVRLYVIVSAEATDPAHPAHQFFVQRYRELSDGISRRLAHAVDRGHLRPDLDVVGAADQLIAILDGLQLHWLLNPRVDRVREFDQYVSQFLTANVGDTSRD